MLRRIKQIFLLTEADLNNNSVWVVRQSALRIILLSAMLLTLLIVVHSSWQAYQERAYHIIWLTSSFYVAILVTLALASRYLALGSWLLLLLIFAAGSCILLFTQEFELAKLGVLLVYTAPLISLIFFSQRVTFAIIAINFVPFTLLLTKKAPSTVFDFSITLPHTYEYLHGLVFLFFNLCLPLAAIRIFSSLRRSSVQLQTLNQQLSHNHQQYENIFENTSLAMILTNVSGEVLKANQRAQVLLAIPDQPDLHIAELLKPDLELPEQSVFWQGQNVECTCLKQAGTVMLSCITTVAHDYYLLQIVDMSELRELHQRLEHNEYERKIWRAYDVLTHLPNQLLFSRMVLKQHQAYTRGLLVIVRLCKLKSFNQQHGYKLGDALLKAFAEKFRTNLPSAAILGRLRGVKFIVWAPITEVNDPSAAAERVLKLLPEDIHIGPVGVSMSYELGLTDTSRPIGSLSASIEQCESALEFANHHTQPVAWYTPDAVAEREQEHALVLELRQQLLSGGFELYLQPKCSAQGKIESFEALLRWERRPGQFVPPDKMVLLAERYGFLVSLSEMVLQLAIQHITRLNSHHIHVPISVNLAGPDILDPLFFASLVSLATHQPWMIERLHIELTETSIISKPQKMFEKLHVLRKLGFNIAIDDFGTGQASLSLLAKLPANTLKLDRSFLAGFPQDKQQLKVLQATIHLARSLELALIVEGVETDIQRRGLLKLGVEYMQGYLFGRPAPIDFWLNQPAKLPLTSKSSHEKALDLAAK